MKRIGDILGGIEVRAIKPKRTSDTGRSTSSERAKRLLNAAEATQGTPTEVLYQHSILCQTGLPYRNPGDDVRTWERTNGQAKLKVIAGEAYNPEIGDFVQLGLPYGPKPRLILAHLNAEALQQQSPEIEIENSLTAFVKSLKLDPKGRNINVIKDQLARLAACSMRFGAAWEGQGITINTQIVTAFNLWFPKENGQRVLWPSVVKLSHEYFESLTKHAVPLHDQALSGIIRVRDGAGRVCLAGSAAAPDRVEPTCICAVGGAQGTVRLAL